MSIEYKIHWMAAERLGFDPDGMKIAFRLTKDGVKKEGVGEVMVSRNLKNKKVALEIIHTVAVSDHEFRTTKYSLPPGFVAKIKKAKTESGEELLWLEA